MQPDATKSALLMFRIRHIPTGLYYCASTTVQVQILDAQGQQQTRWIKTNLSKQGRVYQGRQLQVPAWLKHNYYCHLVQSVSQLDRQGQCLLPVDPAEWQAQLVS